MTVSDDAAGSAAKRSWTLPMRMVLRGEWRETPGVCWSQTASKTASVCIRWVHAVSSARCEGAPACSNQREGWQNIEDAS